MADNLREEYDLKSLEIRKSGSERKHFGGKPINLVAEAADLTIVDDELTINQLTEIGADLSSGSG